MLRINSSCETNTNSKRNRMAGLIDRKLRSKNDKNSDSNVTSNYARNTQTRVTKEVISNIPAEKNASRQKEVCSKMVRYSLN